MEGGVLNILMTLVNSGLKESMCQLIYLTRNTKNII